MMNILFKKNITIFLIILLSGCSHTLHLPSTEKNYKQCSSSVTDERPDSDYIYVIAGSTVFKTKIEPRLDEVIKRRVCNKLNNAKVINLYVEEYECLVSGFFNFDFIVKIRGRMIYKGVRHDLHVSNSFSSSNGNVATGCGLATEQLLKMLTNKVLEQTTVFQEKEQ